MTLQKSSIDLLEKEASRLRKDSSLCKFQSPTQVEINRLRIERKFQEAIDCVVKFLGKSNDEGWAWSTLGDSYQQLRHSKSVSIGNTCFKQAVKLSGKLSSGIREWHFLGPFVIGKTEVDGDPLAYFGGIKNVWAKRLRKNEVFYSELIPNGQIEWKVYKQDSTTSYVEISPRVAWNDLVSSLGSTAITEWQGWVVGEFIVNENNLNIQVQCLGVHTVYIDDIILTGDVYRRDQYWYSVNLKRGFHTMSIRLRAKGQQIFRCQIEQATSNLEISSPHFLPDIWDGHLFSGYIALPITNLQGSKWLKINKISVEDQSDGEAISAEIFGAKSVAIAPGQTLPIRILLSSHSTQIADPNCGAIKIKLKISSSDGQLVFPINLRCRGRDESFLFSFLDHDGSIQHSAAVRPIEPCSDHRCAVLLTLHGTTVPPQNQADSYKRMRNGQYIFGADHAWLVAPTRHGAHNWEGPGALTAMTAATRLCEYVQDHTWITDKASCDHIIFAGHSMGGHGAWHLATHYPDQALALVSLAGWIKKEEYGDSNLFFRHDISTSHVDPAVKAVLESCIAENDADRHVSNLQGIPVLTRVGANDRTIHPYLVRRMYRVLKEQGINVTYVELPGKEHWWWDTNTANDGGCVNDKQIRDFTNAHSLLPTQTCGEEGDCSSTSNSFTIQQPLAFTYIVMNPAFGGSMRGIHLLQQIVPLRKSTIIVSEASGLVSLRTENVRVFTIIEPQNRPLNWKSRQIQIDSQFIDKDNSASITTTSKLYMCLQEGVWNVCEEPMSSLGRLPGTLGPARTVAEHEFIIVTGTLGAEAVTQALQEFAVYVANLFFLTADTYAPIVKDKDLDIQKSSHLNLIVLGNEQENEIAEILSTNLPFSQDEDGHLSLGRCRYSRYGLLSLVPHGDQRLALMLQASDSAIMRDLITLASPTIPPMTRSPFSNLVPDFIVIGVDLAAKGPGGFLCTGHYDNQWKLVSHLVSCSYCL